MKFIGLVAGALILIIIGMTGNVSGLKCYTCNTDDKDGDDVSKCAKTECSSIVPPGAGKPACLKSVGKGGIARVCFYSTENKCTKKGDAEACYCDADLCNGSDGLSGSFFWSLGLFTVTTILNFF